MARLVVKNGLKMDTKVTHGTKRLDYICAHMVDFILGSMVNTNRRTYLNTCSKRESSLWLLITFAFKFWYGNLKWQSLWITIANRMIKFNPKTKIVCKVGSALNMATDPNHYHSGASLYYLIISLSCKFNLVPSHHMTSFRNFAVFLRYMKSTALIFKLVHAGANILHCSKFLYTHAKSHDQINLRDLEKSFKGCTVENKIPIWWVLGPQG